MSDTIASILVGLRQDHKNMALLLACLESESNKIYAGDDPRFELMHDVMQYMTVFPDAVHHPKEDRLYAELKFVRPDLSQGFDRITLDHRNIAEMGFRLREQIESVGSGSIVKRKSVVADSLRYVNTLRSHMQWEELDLFRRCETMAADGHEFVLDAEFRDARDPLFGANAEERFQRLFEVVKSSIADDPDD